MPSTAWGIDVGEHFIKGVKLVKSGSDVRVVAFDRVECASPQTGEPSEREQRLRDALQTFLSRNKVSGPVMVSMPEPAFNRVISLPPVEAKRVDEIVQFEARQRIPFPLEEVTWAYQPLGDIEAASEAKVAIFAVQNQRIHSFISLLNRVKLDPDYVQIPSLGLLNFIKYDRPTDLCTLVVNLGAERTDLIIIDGDNFWTREIRVSGAAITKALMEKFQISQEDAEELKKQGAQSDQADKMAAVIRPILESLVAEIQRSVSHYRSQIDRSAEIQQVLLAGGTSKLIGMQDMLTQSLGLDVAALSEFQRVGVGGEASTPMFTEQVSAYALPTGLALQGLGLASIDINMLPEPVIVEKAIAAKKPYALVALGIIVIVMGILHFGYGRANDKIAEIYEPSNEVYQSVERLVGEYDRLTDTEDLKARLAALEEVTYGSDLWVRILGAVNDVWKQPDVEGEIWLSKLDAFVNRAPQQEFEAMLKGETYDWGKGTKAISDAQKAERISFLTIALDGETPEDIGYVKTQLLPKLEANPDFEGVRISDFVNRRTEEEDPGVSSRRSTRRRPRDTVAVVTSAPKQLPTTFTIQWHVRLKKVSDTASNRDDKS